MTKDGEPANSQKRTGRRPERAERINEENREWLLISAEEKPGLFWAGSLLGNETENEIYLKRFLTVQFSVFLRHFRSIKARTGGDKEN